MGIKGWIKTQISVFSFSFPFPFCPTWFFFHFSFQERKIVWERRKLRDAKNPRVGRIKEVTSLITCEKISWKKITKISQNSLRKKHKVITIKTTGKRCHNIKQIPRRVLPLQGHQLSLPQFHIVDPYLTWQGNFVVLSGLHYILHILSTN